MLSLRLVKDDSASYIVDMPPERHAPSLYLSKWMKICITNYVLAVLRLFRHYDGSGFNWFRVSFAWIVVILHKNNFIHLFRAKRLSSRRSSYLCILRRHCQRVTGLYELQQTVSNLIDKFRAIVMCLKTVVIEITWTSVARLYFDVSWLTYIVGVSCTGTGLRRISQKRRRLFE